MARAYVGLGANLGPREATILRAVDLLAAQPGIELLELSSLVETEPVGVTDQPEFVNGAVSLDTTLPPRELLEALLRVERELGRVRTGERWGPRTIDLDLIRALLYLQSHDARIKGRVLKYLRCEDLSDHDRVLLGGSVPRTYDDAPQRVVQKLGELMAALPEPRKRDLPALADEIRREHEASKLAFRPRWRRW